MINECDEIQWDGSMNVLFVHQNFRAQFRHVASALAASGKAQLAVVTDAANTRVQADDGGPLQVYAAR
jgi:hypothetical protein